MSSHAVLEACADHRVRIESAQKLPELTADEQVLYDCLLVLSIYQAVGTVGIRVIGSMVHTPHERLEQALHALYSQGQIVANNDFDIFGMAPRGKATVVSYQGGNKSHLATLAKPMRSR